MQLRDYQTEAVQACYSHLRTRDDNPCIVIPTGGGKTPVLAQICLDATLEWGGRVLILSHVKELLEQAVHTLHGIDPRLIPKVGVYSAGLGRREVDYPIIVAGIQSVYKKATKMGKYDLIIIDECFPSGTLIDTPSGPRPIDLVRCGDTVYNSIGAGVVEAVSARSAEWQDMLRMEFSDGTTIECTANHPFLTASGWCPAWAMVVGEIAIGREGVRALREAVSSMGKDFGGRQPSRNERRTLEQAKLLLTILREETQEPDEQSPVAAEDAGAVARNQTQADQAGRERRPVVVAAVGAASRAGGRVGVRIPREARKAASTRIADLLQVGLGEPAIENRNRGRWREPHDNRTARTGRAQGLDTLCPRLVSVSGVKPSSPRTVFNLQVSGHPSYFAGGKLVHNCHLIPVDGEGMYRTFLADAKLVNPNVRVIGLTATPYRMKDGMICGPDNILNEICHETGVRELIARGFLCNLKSRAGTREVNTDGLHIKAGEFVQQEMEALMGEDDLVVAACADVVNVANAEARKSCLIFAAGVEHGGKVAAEIRRLTGAEVGEIYADTKERSTLIKDFREGRLRYLVNMNVLTIGFDAPNVDMIALLRPTASPGLYYQMVGRGFRIAPGKDYCRVLDYGENVIRHGPVDCLKPEARPSGEGGEAPAKKCDACGALVHAAYRVCPECGADFPKIEKKHATKHSDAGVLSGEIVTEDLEVEAVFYSVHTKKGADAGAPKTMKVSYQPMGIRADLISEWVCVEHPAGSFPQRKAVMWWRARSKLVCPATAAESVSLAQEGALAKPTRIRVEHAPGEKFPRIVSAEIGELPEFRPWQDGIEDRADEEAARAERFAATRKELESDSYEPPF